MFHGMLIMLPVCRNILALLQRVPLLRHWVNFDKNMYAVVVVVR